MGRLRKKRNHHARRDVHRAARTRVRVKDLDQIEEDLRGVNRAKLESQPLDEELPGLGQHYCVECAKYCETNLALISHQRSKVHRRRLKELRQPAYTIRESEAAAGLSAADNKQRGVEEVRKRMEGGMQVESAEGAPAPVTTQAAGGQA